MSTGDSILASVQSALYCAQTAVDVELRKRDQRIAELETLLGGSKGVQPASVDYLCAFARLGDILGFEGRFLVDFGFEDIEREAARVVQFKPAGMP